MKRSLLFLLLVASQTIVWAQDNSTSISRPQDFSKATVYVYRYKQFVGAALAPSVYCDDVQLARMENGRYFTTSVAPGKHIFRSNDEQSGIVLQAVAGQQYFIRVDIAAGFMKGHGRLTLMDEQQGVYELTSDKLKPLDASKVIDKERVSVEVAHPPAQTPAAKTPAPSTAPAPTATSNSTPTASNTAAVAAASQTSSAGTSEPALQNVVTTGGVSTSSASGEQTSLGDAARQARQKKQPQK
jgi:cell division septation protein DedD